MAKAWKDVIASPQYQALTEEQKAQAQAQYFDEVVAPKAGDKWAEARDQFYAAYPPPQQQKEEPSLMQQAKAAKITENTLSARFTHPYNGLKNAGFPRHAIKTWLPATDVTSCPSSWSSRWS